MGGTGATLEIAVIAVVGDLGTTVAGGEGRARTLGTVLGDVPGTVPGTVLHGKKGAGLEQKCLGLPLWGFKKGWDVWILDPRVFYYCNPALRPGPLYFLYKTLKTKWGNLHQSTTSGC